MVMLSEEVALGICTGGFDVHAYPKVQFNRVGGTAGATVKLLAVLALHELSLIGELYPLGVE